MHVNDFKISKASVKELIITDILLNYEGSIRLAFPDLVCFCGGSNLDEQTAVTLPAIWDLILLSNELKELVLYRPKDLPAVQTTNPLNVPAFKQFVPPILKTAKLYPVLS